MYCLVFVDLLFQPHVSLVVFDALQICKYVARLHIIMTSIKENIITKLQNYISHLEALGQATNPCYF